MIYQKVFKSTGRKLNVELSEQHKYMRQTICQYQNNLINRQNKVYLDQSQNNNIIKQFLSMIQSTKSQIKKENAITKIQLGDLFIKPVQIKICQPTPILDLLSCQFNNKQPFNNEEQAKGVFNKVIALKCKSIKQALMLLAISLNKRDLAVRMKGIQQFKHRDQMTKSLQNLQYYLGQILYNTIGNSSAAVQEIVHTKISTEGKLGWVDNIISGMTLYQVKSFFYKSIAEETDLRCLRRATIHFIDDQADSPAKLYTLKTYDTSKQTIISSFQYIYVCYGLSAQDGCYLILVNAKKQERGWSEEANGLKLEVEDVNQQVLKANGFLYKQQAKIEEQKVEKIDFSQFKKQQQDPIPKLPFRTQIQPPHPDKDLTDGNVPNDRKQQKQQKQSNLGQKIGGIVIIVLAFCLFLYSLITQASAPDQP